MRLTWKWLLVAATALAVLAFAACSDNDGGEDTGDEEASVGGDSAGGNGGGTGLRPRDREATRAARASATAAAAGQPTRAGSSTTATPTRAAATPTSVPPTATRTQTGPSGLGPSTPPSDNFKAATTVVKKDAAAGVPQVVVDTVTFSSHAGFDRITFEFTGNLLPGYEVRYVQAVTACGSGAPVGLPGFAAIQVRLTPAIAHDASGSTVSSTTVSGGTAISQAKQTCDFEGVVAWGIGVNTSARPFRVTELVNPPALLVDVQH